MCCTAAASAAACASCAAAAKLLSSRGGSALALAPSCIMQKVIVVRNSGRCCPFTDNSKGGRVAVTVITTGAMAAAHRLSIRHGYAQHEGNVIQGCMPSRQVAGSLQAQLQLAQALPRVPVLPCSCLLCDGKAVEQRRLPPCPLRRLTLQLGDCGSLCLKGVEQQLQHALRRKGTVGMAMLDRETAKLCRRALRWLPCALTCSGACSNNG